MKKGGKAALGLPGLSARGYLADDCRAASSTSSDFSMWRTSRSSGLNVALRLSADDTLDSFVLDTVTGTVFLFSDKLVYGCGLKDILRDDIHPDAQWRSPEATARPDPGRIQTR